MSNSANSDEIDQVMSSVRKLVTKDESKTLPAAAELGSLDASERLILTPALRVEDTPQQDDDTPPQADNVLVLDPGNRTELEGLEATIAELEAAVTAQPDDWEPDEGETFDEAAWAVSAFAMPDTQPEPDVAVSAEGEPEAKVEPEAGVEPEVGVEPEADSEADVAVETDMPTEVDAGVTPEDENFEAGLSDFLDPGATIDQDILRDMIVQIVREELSGDTGERITRNVRKLVRREINQILATRGLE